MCDTFYPDDYKGILEHMTSNGMIPGIQPLVEMAFPQKEFVARVIDESDNIVVNWCIIKYAVKYGIGQPTIGHWSKELLACMGKISKSSIKQNNSIENRTKRITDAFNTALDIESGFVNISETFWIKCQGEQMEATGKHIPILEYDREKANLVAKEFHEAVPTLINLMSIPNNTDGIIQYVNGLRNNP